MRLLNFLKHRPLLIVSVFLLAFIPLYPKLPLLGVSHTFVYIRLDDIFIALADLIYLILLFKKRATLNTPLTAPFFIFWGIGLISTVFAVFFIFPRIANVFPNVAWFTYLRHIEYLSVFFVAYSAVKSKMDIRPVIGVMALTVMIVALYGFGQKFLGYPAFLTMNEEFAKGIPLRLSSADRIPSTFAGHYDLAAYLVISLPILASMLFAFKNFWVRIGLFASSLAGLSVLLLTASRVSFMMYIITILIMLVIQKQKKWIIPFLVFSLLYLNLFQGITQRFTSTLSQADVVYDARTGKAIGIAKPASGQNHQLVIEDKQLTGENLPQGSGYISLPSSQNDRAVSNILYKKTHLKGGTELTEQTNLAGSYVVKRALAYDVSFTTRFQGEWPRAINAFLRNPLLGSGYSSISVATDNNYLRIFGEIGILGFISFFLIFIFASIYIKHVFNKIDSKPIQSFVIGIIAGVVGLLLNAVLIDVFEASKVAYVLWLLIGLALGLLHFYKTDKINYFLELKNLFLSKAFITIYLICLSVVVFSFILNNFFVGDDFIWLKWAAECNKITYISGITTCEPVSRTILHYFINSQGFFYRPGTKIFFFLFYAINWLNPQIYHLFSILMHGLSCALVFLISQKLLKSKFFGLVSACLFLVLSIHSETIFWISSVGHLVTSACILLCLYLYIQWTESRKIYLLILSFLSALISLLFHEMGIISPFLIMFYDLIYVSKFNASDIFRKWHYLLFLLLIPFYAVIRILTHSQWFFGDYSYNLLKFPVNAVGNTFGYLLVVLLGAKSMFYYDLLRNYGRAHALIFTILCIILFLILIYVFRKVRSMTRFKIDKVTVFCVSFFIISLLPYLGLGNIATRYAYLASFAVVLYISHLLQNIYNNKQLLLVFRNIFIIFFVLLFCLINVYELKNINQDWQKAGSITNKALISLQSTFTVTRKATGNPVFYFSDVPIKWGEAWVFPVGLPEAVWFDFQGENLTVHQVKTLSDGLKSVQGSESARLFDFEKNGTLDQITNNGKVW